MHGRSPKTTPIRSADWQIPLEAVIVAVELGLDVAAAANDDDKDTAAVEAVEEGAGVFGIVVIVRRGGRGAFSILSGAATDWDVFESAVFSPVPPAVLRHLNERDTTLFEPICQSLHLCFLEHLLTPKTNIQN
ncbi:hypothetical protein Adt_48050 [Abeliophyllum distichum]|uniref:Uncharacterized protein n=1 Tax=Abeliophyllum distichum TaxID=126358 RepID=A0ABD1NU24_9LAMI